jgi:hypothetical protein
VRNKRIPQVQRFTIVLERYIFEYRICAEITLLKYDIHVLITGGSLPHTGAVSMYFDGEQDGSIQPEGHKDKVVADLWSKKLSEEFHCRVTTVCGIHYERLSEKGIAEIVSVTEEMLAEAISEIRREESQ